MKDFTADELQGLLIRALQVMSYASGYCDGLDKPCDYLNEEVDYLSNRLGLATTEDEIQA